MKQEQLVANRRKSEFDQTQIKYLGHIISSKGVEMDGDKINTIVEWERPRTVKSLRGFLGLTGHYQRFVRDYGKTTIPLTELVKKDGFTWNAEVEETWETLKKAMTKALVLSLPDFRQSFHIKCDAFGRGMGAILMQERRPIAYFSKALSEGKLSKLIYEKELMALVIALEALPHRAKVCHSHRSKKPPTFTGTTYYHGKPTRLDRKVVGVRLRHSLQIRGCE